MKHIILGAMFAALVGCGEAEDTSTPDTSGETSETRSAASPSSAPPELQFAEDGDTYRANVGDEISVKFELPDTVGTASMWQLKDNAWPDFLSWGNTWTTMEGSQRYIDVVINADAPGEADLTFEQFSSGQATGETVTVTVVVD